MNKIFTGGALAALLLTAPAHAAGPLALVSWAGISSAAKQLAQEVGVEMAADYLKGLLKHDEIEKLRAEVNALKTQAASQQAAAPPAEFAQVQALLKQSEQVLASQALQVKHNSEAVADLQRARTHTEQAVALLQNEVAALRKQLAESGVALQKPLTADNALQVYVNYAYRAQGQGELQKLSDGTVLRSGDQYKISFTPQRDAWVYIFQTDSSGKIFQLFPLEEMGGVAVNQTNPVKAGEQRTVPAADKSFFLDQQTGTETLYFIAAPQRDDDLEARYEAYRKALALPQGQVQMAQAKLEQSLYGRGPGGIVADPAATAKQSVPNDDGGSAQMEAGFLAGLCSRPQGCINVLRFEHR